MRGLRLGLSLLVLLTGSVSCGGANSAQGLPLHQIRLPTGFEIGIYASHAPNARSMALSPNGAMLVSDDEADVIYRISYRK